MRNLICWCPQTQRPIDLQLFTDYVTLARIWSSSVRFHCPHCGLDHETKVGAAWLQTTPPSQTHEGIRTPRGEVSNPEAPRRSLAARPLPKRFACRKHSQ